MLLALGAAAQTTHVKFTEDGEFGLVTQLTGPHSFFTLKVSRNSATGSTNTVTLHYDQEAANFTPQGLSFTSVVIVGAIPSSAFTGSINHLVMNFDLSQLDPTTSISIACTTLPFQLPVCGPGPTTGLINVEWLENYATSSEVALIKLDTSGPLTTTVHQHSDDSTATVQGSVLGVTLNTPFANVGMNHSSTLEVTSNQ
jgi:hypothetical protein